MLFSYKDFEVFMKSLQQKATKCKDISFEQLLGKIDYNELCENCFHLHPKIVNEIISGNYLTYNDLDQTGVTQKSINDFLYTYEVVFHNQSFNNCLYSKAKNDEFTDIGSLFNYQIKDTVLKELSTISSDHCYRLFSLVRRELEDKNLPIDNIDGLTIKLSRILNYSYVDFKREFDEDETANLMNFLETCAIYNGKMKSNEVKMLNVVSTIEYTVDNKIEIALNTIDSITYQDNQMIITLKENS